MHLDTVFTFCDRDLVTLFAEVVDQIQCFSMHPTDDQGGFGFRHERVPQLGLKLHCKDGFLRHDHLL